MKHPKLILIGQDDNNTLKIKYEKLASFDEKAVHSHLPFVVTQQAGMLKGKALVLDSDYEWRIVVNELGDDVLIAWGKELF